MHADSQQIRRGTSQSQTPARLLVGINVFNLIEALQQTDKHIASFGKGELLSNTDTRPPVERDILPTSFAVQPALGLETVRVGVDARVMKKVALVDRYWGLEKVELRGSQTKRVYLRQGVSPNVHT